MMTNMEDWTWPELKAEATDLAAELENDCDLASASYKAAVMGLLVERLAALIEPQPIRRGDVVQDANPAGNHDTMIVLENYGKSMEVWVMGGCVRTINSPGLARIGRARYYPDGTPVED